MNFRQSLYGFFNGRNGFDALGKTAGISALVLFILSAVFKSGFLYILAIALIFYAYFRIMSKNLTRRRGENAKFLSLSWHIRAFFVNIGVFFRNIGVTFKNFKDRIINRFSGVREGSKIFTCPECGQKVRVPAHRGRIMITCPKCHKEFVKRS